MSTQNAVHEIDMVPSSLGSSKADSNPSSQRRHIVSKLPSFILARHKSPKQQQQHSPLSINEEELTFLGQGWFRSAWKMDQTLNWGEWDEEEEEWVFKESVVLKTLR